MIRPFGMLPLIPFVGESALSRGELKAIAEEYARRRRDAFMRESRHDESMAAAEAKRARKAAKRLRNRP